jgi:hypothetical protein
MESVISEKKEGKSGKSESRLFAPFRSHVDPLCLSDRGPFYDRARNAAVTVASWRPHRRPSVTGTGPILFSRRTVPIALVVATRPISPSPHPPVAFRSASPRCIPRPCRRTEHAPVTVKLDRVAVDLLARSSTREGNLFRFKSTESSRHGLAIYMLLARVLGVPTGCEKNGG